MVVKLLILEEETTESQASIKDYCQSLNPKEYELIFAFSGEEALEIIEQDRNREIDLLISGLSMPTSKIDGWQLIKTLACHQIDLKIIVVSAWGKLEDFDEDSRQNIIFFADKNTISKEILKYLVESSLRLPERFTINSKKVRLNTLLKAAKELPSKQKVKLFDKLLGELDFKEFRILEKNLPSLLEKYKDELIKKDDIRQWLSEKEETGEFKLPVSIKNINVFSVGRNKLSSGIYYRIQWTQNGKFFYKQIPVALSQEFSLLLSPKEQKEKKKT